jgi:flagellar biosynthesis chaperone FliJ
MNLQSKRELEVTREKLKMLEEQYEATRAKPAVDKHVQELTLQSLKKLINQLKEEIMRCQSRMSAPSRDA